MPERVVLDAAAVEARLRAELPAWRLEGGALARTYRAAGWKGALMVANAVGHLAEAAWHHPELTVAYGRVAVRLTTHEAGGVTERDLALARRIEALIAWRPGPGDGGLTGPPEDPRHVYVRRDP